MTSTTFAPDVFRPAMEFKLVLKCRKLSTLTSYKADAWEHLLDQAGLTHMYSHISNSLCFGFNIKLPTILSTQTPPNWPSIIELHSQLLEIVQAEFGKGHYIGPLSRASLESLIGPFQTSPFAIIPKPAKIGKFHILQNFWFLYNTSVTYPNPSINSFINSNNFPTTWGTFSVTCLMLHQLPLGSQITTRDVSKVYQTVPLHLSQWPAMVTCLNEDRFTIDTSLCFSVSPSASTYRKIHQASSDILHHHEVGPLSGWVDNHLFTCIPCKHLNEYNIKHCL